VIPSLTHFFHVFTDPPRKRSPWYDTRLSYNPAIHRMKQALFHGAIVEDLVADPLLPPHPDLTKYLEPPKKVLKRANEAVDQCKTAFAITKGLIWINSAKKDFSLCLQSERESHDHAKKITRALKMTTMRSFFLIV
jgi:ATP-dependent DNA helicase 2 subunit 2